MPMANMSVRAGNPVPILCPLMPFCPFEDLQDEIARVNIVARIPRERCKTKDLTVVCHVVFAGTL